MPAEQAAPEKEAAPQKKKRLPMVLGIVAGMAVLQGVGFFVIFKMMGGRPAAAHGEDNHAVEAPPASQPATLIEVPLLKGVRVPNDKSGRMWLYDFDLVVVVPADKKDAMAKLATDRAGEIADCVARVVRGASDRMLREDNLSVLRSQLLQGFNEISGDDKLIERVLIPRFVPLPL